MEILRIFNVKLILAIALLLVALLGGLLPHFFLKKIQKKRIAANRFVYFGNSFANGVLLTISLVHLLPEAVELWRQVFSPEIVLGPFLVAVFTVVSLQFIEAILAKKFSFSKNIKQFTLSGSLVLVMLSLHSIFEGIALGSSDKIGIVLMIFSAILLHKTTAAFALGVNLECRGIKKGTFILQKIILFSLMTPLGIFLGSSLIMISQGKNAILIQALMNSIAAGTFIYIVAILNENKVCSHDPITFSEEFFGWVLFTIATTITALAAFVV